MKKRYVRDLVVDEFVHDVFVVRKKQLKQTRKGDSYIDLVLADRTGEVDAKIWSNSAAMGVAFERGDFVAVSAGVEDYGGKVQLNIHDLKKVAPEDVEISDFVPSSAHDADEMLASLKQIASSLENPHLRALLQEFFSDEELIGRFKTAPAAVRMHHTYVGGLLEHTLSVVGLAELVCKHYPDLDRDLLIASAILHDVGKIEEISWDGVEFDYTVKGRFLGHTVLGLEIVSRLLERVEGFPEPLALELLHIIASHHGEMQFGAPKEPVTKEALVLHYLDNIDAKLQMAGSAIEDAEGEAWTEYSKGLRRVMYSEGKKGYQFSWPSAPDAGEPAGEDEAGSEADLRKEAEEPEAGGDESKSLDDHPFLTLFDEEDKKR